MEIYSGAIAGGLFSSVPALIGWIIAVIFASIMLKHGGNAFYGRGVWYSQGSYRPSRNSLSCLRLLGEIQIGKMNNFSLKNL